jgi:hypothetical protein
MKNKQPNPQPITVFKLTHEDWHPSFEIAGYYQGKTEQKMLEVSYIGELRRYENQPQVWRTCVWGADDFGMEYDSSSESDAFDKFMQVIRMEFVCSAALKNLGFVPA